MNYPDLNENPESNYSEVPLDPEDRPTFDSLLKLLRSRQYRIFMPYRNIDHIMRSVLPRDFKVQQETKELMQVILTEFVLFITTDAIERVKENNRVAVQGGDVLEALEALGYGHYTPVLRELKAKYSQTKAIVKEESMRKKEEGSVKIEEAKGDDVLLEFWWLNKRFKLINDLVIIWFIKSEEKHMKNEEVKEKKVDTNKKMEELKKVMESSDRKMEDLKAKKREYLECQDHS